MSGGSVHNDTDMETQVISSRSLVSQDTQEVSMDKFKSYPLHGNKAEGLDYAMRVGLWGHTLFLASKMDQKTNAGVMTRFANGLAINDPLQTLYQLMSFRFDPILCPLGFFKLNYSRFQDSHSHEAVRGYLAAAPGHDSLKLRNK